MMYQVTVCQRPCDKRSFVVSVVYIMSTRSLTRSIAKFRLGSNISGTLWFRVQSILGTPSRAQGSKSFPAPVLASLEGIWTESGASGLGPRRTKVMARSAFWRVSINASPAEYVSSCSSGNSSKGSSPSSNSRQRESCSTSPSPM